jgi:D-alanine-D-alanine ligase
MNAIDVKDLGKVAVLMGGDSAERPVSFMSGNGVLAALRSQGVDAHAFDPAERPLTELKTMAKTAPCKARWNCSASPIPAPA